MPALSNFTRRERLRRGWTIPLFAAKAGISQSLGYQLDAGKDNVRQDTFEGIASAFDMTPAELMMAVGKGARPADSRRAPLLAMIWAVPDEDLGTVERVVRPFMSAETANNTSGHPAANSTGSRNNNRRGGQQPPFQTQKRDLVLAAWTGLCSAISAPFAPRRPLTAAT